MFRYPPFHVSSYRSFFHFFFPTFSNISFILLFGLNILIFFNAQFFLVSIGTIPILPDSSFMKTLNESLSQEILDAEKFLHLPFGRDPIKIVVHQNHLFNVLTF